MNILLISTYELGHQPLGLASPARWLTDAGFSVKCLDLSIQKLDEKLVEEAQIIGFSVPMHTATRLAARAARKVREINPDAALIFYGLYAPLNRDYLQSLGASAFIGGEYEQRLVEVIQKISRGESLEEIDSEASPLVRLNYKVPKRDGLPPLKKYTRLSRGDKAHKITGYTETTRGCLHSCTHCPVVPIYGGRFFGIPRKILLRDIAQQVEMGAEHITFGDPDFFNRPGHGTRLVEEMHRSFPHLTYDVTIKVEHLLGHRRYLSMLAKTGCLFITTAVESFEDPVLEKYQKGHSFADFKEALDIAESHSLSLSPTFVAFSPWTTLENYSRFLGTTADLDLVDMVSPIQYSIRLLIPPGSLLLQDPEIRELIGPLDPERLLYPWESIDPRIDHLQRDLEELVNKASQEKLSRREIFSKIWDRAHRDFKGSKKPSIKGPQKRVPFLLEPWY